MISESEKLYVVTVIFNPRGFKSRINLYRDFAPYVTYSGAELITVEVAYGNREYEVTEPNNPHHVQVRSDCEMWHKERGLNLGIQQVLKLYPEAKKVAWIDADVKFSNPNWVNDTLIALDHYNVVQLFSEAQSLNPRYESQWKTPGIFYNYINKIGYHQKPALPVSYTKGGHPGLAWAATMQTLSDVGGLLDFCVHGCYDNQTEVYTQRGFIPFSELTMYDKVLSRTLNEEVEWGDVIELHKYPYKGEMYKIKSESLDLVVTPNHNMLYRKISSNNLYFEKMEDIKADRRIPKVSKWNIAEPVNFKLYGASSIENFVAFMGIWLAEGWIYLATNKPDGTQPHYRIGIAQNKKESLEKIKELLDITFPQISWVASTKKGQLSGYIGSNKELFNYLQQFGKVYDKFVHEDIKNLPTKYLNIFLQWFIMGDGHIEKKKNGKHADTISLYTSSKKLRDDLIEIVIKTGSWASYGESLGKLSQPLADGRQIQSNLEFPHYDIRLQKSQNFFLKQRSISKIDYDGMVYCCETPNHVLLVKRGKKIIWCGNSGDTHMANALMGDINLYNSTYTSNSFNAMLQLWADRCNKYVKKNIGYVNGICYHYWHGKPQKRGYEKRFDLICFHDFDPLKDIYTDVTGLYRWSGDKKEFEQDLRRSMISRNEDSIDD